MLNKITITSISNKTSPELVLTVLTKNQVWSQISFPKYGHQLQQDSIWINNFSSYILYFFLNFLKNTDKKECQLRKEYKVVENHSGALRAVKLKHISPSLAGDFRLKLPCLKLILVKFEFLHNSVNCSIQSFGLVT